MLPLKRPCSLSRTETAISNPKFGVYIIYIYMPQHPLFSPFFLGRKGKEEKKRKEKGKGNLYVSLQRGHFLIRVVRASSSHHCMYVCMFSRQGSRLRFLNEDLRLGLSESDERFPGGWMISIIGVM